MDRHWLITWTCYGTWLPVDSRGFVGNVRDHDWEQVVHNTPGTPYDADLPRLEAHIRWHLSGPPVTLTQPEANALIAQYQETCRVRQWYLQAASVMFNHTHPVVGVVGDPEPELILATFKNWSTRAVKKLRPVPPNGTFWTAKGSTRRLPNEPAVQGAVVYVVRKQPNPLAVYWAQIWQSVLDVYDRELAARSR